MVDLSSVPEHSRRVATYDTFKVLQNGRIRYYGTYKPARISGRTAGARLVVEVNSSTGKPLRSWYESYDNGGKVIRVHPKTPRDLGHIEIDPTTGRATDRW